VEAQILLEESAALDAYEGLAAHYDEFTAGYDYETWLTNLEGLALEHGLSGRRLLDVACGTGKSFEPMARRGYEVAACDLSPAMVERARAKAPPGAELWVADMRTLAPLGEFDLVTCLDDSLNYALSSEALEASIAGMAANLAPGGLLAFDLNSLGTYRRLFGGDSVRESEGVVFCWRGRPRPDGRPGEVFEATIDVFALEGSGCWRRSLTTHRQRHHPREEVEGAVRKAGLELAAVRGQLPGARLERGPDEERHQKLVFLARKGG
jgi:SAM-dependent methyltransferase